MQAVCALEVFIPLLQLICFAFLTLVVKYHCSVPRIDRSKALSFCIDQAEGADPSHWSFAYIPVGMLSLAVAVGLEQVCEATPVVRIAFYQMLLDAILDGMLSVLSRPIQASTGRLPSSCEQNIFMVYLKTCRVFQMMQHIFELLLNDKALEAGPVENHL